MADSEQKYETLDDYSDVDRRKMQLEKLVSAMDIFMMCMLMSASIEYIPALFLPRLWSLYNLSLFAVIIICTGFVPAFATCWLIESNNWNIDYSKQITYDMYFFIGIMSLGISLLFDVNDVRESGFYFSMINIFIIMIGYLKSLDPTNSKIPLTLSTITIILGSTIASVVFTNLIFVVPAITLRGVMWSIFLVIYMSSSINSFLLDNILEDDVEYKVVIYPMVRLVALIRNMIV